jgi:hypothetical protein
MCKIVKLYKNNFIIKFYTFLKYFLIDFDRKRCIFTSKVTSTMFYKNGSI